MIVDASHFVSMEIGLGGLQLNGLWLFCWQAMTESWSVPFLDAFSGSAEVQVYEVTTEMTALYLCKFILIFFLFLLNVSAVFSSIF